MMNYLSLEYITKRMTPTMTKRTPKPAIVNSKKVVVFSLPALGGVLPAVLVVVGVSVAVKVGVGVIVGVGEGVNVAVGVGVSVLMVRMLLSSTLSVGSLSAMMLIE